MFASLKRDYIWKSLTKFDTTNQINNAIKLMSGDYTCNVKYRDTLTDDVQTKCGMKQGCILSPIILLTFMIRL